MKEWARDAARAGVKPSPYTEERGFLKAEGAVPPNVPAKIFLANSKKKGKQNKAGRSSVGGNPDAQRRRSPSASPG